MSEKFKLQHFTFFCRKLNQNEISSMTHGGGCNCRNAGNHQTSVETQRIPPPSLLVHLVYFFNLYYKQGISGHFKCRFISPYHMLMTPIHSTTFSFSSKVEDFFKF